MFFFVRAFLNTFRSLITAIPSAKSGRKYTKTFYSSKHNRKKIIKHWLPAKVWFLLLLPIALLTVEEHFMESGISSKFIIPQRNQRNYSCPVKTVAHEMKFKITLLLYGLCTTVALGQTVLKYDLKEGEVFTIKQTAEQVITQELDGEAHVLTNTLDGLLEFKVLGEREGNYKVEMTFRDLNMLMTSSIQGELMNVHANEVSEGDIQSQIFHSLLNNPVEMTVAKNGDILNVAGGESLITRMANASGLEDDFSKNMMKKNLEKEFGSEALSNSYEQLTYIYANGKVKVGDTWQNEFTGKLDAKNTWKLDALADNSVTISGNAEVNMQTEDTGISMNLNGFQTTMIIADRTSGFIKTMKVEGEFTGASVMPQMGETKIPTTIKSITTYKLIKT